MKVLAILLGCMGLLAGTGFAHCDTALGPVVPEAKTALEKGDITPILKWVKPAHEAEVRAAFARAVTVRAKGPEARELADQFFLETLVRLHRAGEGAFFTGIKQEPVDPVLALADQALASGSADELLRKLNAHVTGAVRAKFQKALETSKRKDKDVEAGREFVAAYVAYMHTIEGLDHALRTPDAHAHSEPGTPHRD